MSYKTLLIAFLFFAFGQSSQAQYTFSGQVSQDFIGSNAYLVLIDDYKKSDLFLTDQIIQEVPIDSLGHFEFKGNFLSSENRFYKIYIDQCNDDVSDFNHLLKHCDHSNSVLFLANNSDRIHFPINAIDQMFCSLEYSRSVNNALFQIDSIQEVLLHTLHDAKNDRQRKIIFKNYFKELQSFSVTFEEPLVELYAYHVYANHQSFSRDYYLEDVQQSNYYPALLSKLESNYPNSSYTEQFKSDLATDTYKKSDSKNSLIIGLLLALLTLSVTINYILLRKRRLKKSKLNYKEVLSPQELKVFELMYQEVPNKEIAEKLFISLSTVKTHVNNIYTKLKVSSRKELKQFY